MNEWMNAETYEWFRSATKKHFYELALTNWSHDCFRCHDSFFLTTHGALPNSYNNNNNNIHRPVYQGVHPTGDGVWYLWFPRSGEVGWNVQVNTTMENILTESTAQLSSKSYIITLHPSLVFHNLLPYPVTCKLQVCPLSSAAQPSAGASSSQVDPDC